MSTSFSILGAVVVFAAAQLLLRKDAPAYEFLLSVGAALFVLLQLGAAVQELVQREPNRTLVYRMAEESGPDHDKTFTFEVLLNGAVVGRGEGHSKKEAEQMAARAALERLE